MDFTIPPALEALRSRIAAFVARELIPIESDPDAYDGHENIDPIRLRELRAKARAERRSKKPRVRFVPSRVLMNTNLSRNLSASLEDIGKKVLPGIGQRIVLAEAVSAGLTIQEFAPSSAAREEFETLAKAVDKILRK